MRKVKKFRKRFNQRLIKVRRTYSISEICELYGVHPNTVMNWINEQGLKRIDDCYPYLVYGQVLFDFITARQTKIKLEADEFNCLKCGCARRAWEGVVDVHVYTPKIANLEAICEVCSANIYRMVGVTRLPEVGKIFKIQQVHNQRLIEGDGLSGNCESEQG